MKASKRIRQFHRWLSIIFTVTVIIAFIATVTQPVLPFALVYAPLLPLALQLITGLYLFALPYLNKRRAAKSSPHPA
ncbi:hypothetical protein GCM10028864_23460 [Microlunatus parietis]